MFRCIVFTLLLLLLHFSTAVPGRQRRIQDTKQKPVKPPIIDKDKALLRTQAIIQNKSEFGRIILLLCKKTCPKLRSQVPQIVRDYNDEKHYSHSDLIHYHYHNLRISIESLNVTVDEFTQPTLLYISSGEVQKYPYDTINQADLWEWIASLDTHEIIKPQNHFELETLLAKKEENCSGRYLLMINDPRDCPLPHWRNIARLVFQHTKIPTIRIERPLDSKVAATIFRRLPQLPPDDCLIMTLIHQDRYTLPIPQLTPQGIDEAIRQFLTEDDCVVMDQPSVLSIGEPLTDLQLEYFSSEMELKKLEHKPSYIAVGLAGGIAVVALAISIFWGLNGSAFTRE